jgi:hypothetical protein
MAGLLNATAENTTSLCSQVTALCGNHTAGEGNVSSLCQNLTSFCAPSLKPPLTVGVIFFQGLLSLALICAFIITIHLCIRMVSTDRTIWDLIRDEYWYPSLAITQFLIWTIIITWSYILIAILRIQEGIIAYPETLPINLLILMGISIVVPVVSGKMAPLIYGQPETSRPRPKKLPPLGTMVMENGKPSLGRFQMALWTLISVLVYLFIFGSTLIASLTDITKLVVPDIDVTLVVLMGLSQGAYLGGKLVIMSTTEAEVNPSPATGSTGQSSIEITDIQPGYGKPGEEIILFGKDFGNSKEAVWFDTIKISGDAITDWSEKRITIKIPVSLQTAQTGPVGVKVSTKEGLSAAKQFVLY